MDLELDEKSKEELSLLRKDISDQSYEEYLKKHRKITKFKIFGGLLRRAKIKMIRDNLVRADHDVYKLEEKRFMIYPKLVAGLSGLALINTRIFGIFMKVTVSTHYILAK